MKQFLDFTGLSYFLTKLKTIFVSNIKTDTTAGDAASGTITFEKTVDGEVVETTVPVKNVVTTDTAQTISGAKTFTGAVKVPDIADGATDTGLAANKGYVDSKITENDAMSYKGAVVPNSETGKHLPFVAEGSTKNRVDFKVGSTFKASAEGTYYYAEGGGEGKQQIARSGDLFIVNDLTEITPSTSPKTWTITWDYIPAADDVTSVQYSADGTGINVGTSPTYGKAIFGEAAIKPVDTSIAAGSTSENLPTSAAVADYAISGVTAGSGIEVGTKTNGTQDIKIQLSHIGSDSSDPFAGLKFNTTTDMTTPGLAIDNGDGITFANDGKLKVKANTNQGIEVTSNGIGIALYTGSSETPVPSSGLEFDSSDGKLKVKTGDGLDFANSGALKVNANTDQGIEVTSSGVGVKLAEEKDKSSGRLVNVSGLSFDEDGKLKVITGSSITVREGGLDVNYGKGLMMGSHTGTLDLCISNDNSNGLSVDSNGLGLSLATPSTNGVGGSAGAMSAEDKEKLDNLDSAYAKNLDVAAGANNTVDLQLKDGQGTAAVLDTVNISSTNKAISVGVGTASGSTTKLEITANVDEHNGLKVDSSTGIKLDIDTTAGLKETASGNKLAINNGNGITFTNGAIEAKIDSTNNTGGLDFDANGNIEVVSIENGDIDTLFA